MNYVPCLDGGAGHRHEPGRNHCNLCGYIFGSGVDAPKHLIRSVPSRRVLRPVDVSEHLPKIVRLAVRDGDRCFFCGFDHWNEKRYRTVDHLMPRSRGGSNDDSNCRLACNVCNNLKDNHVWVRFNGSWYAVDEVTGEAVPALLRVPVEETV